MKTFFVRNKYIIVAGIILTILFYLFLVWQMQKDSLSDLQKLKSVLQENRLNLTDQEIIEIKNRSFWSIMMEGIIDQIYNLFILLIPVYLILFLLKKVKTSIQASQ